MVNHSPIHIAIFASGAGSNAANIIHYLQKNATDVSVGLIVCNKPDAGVLTIAKSNNIQTLIIQKERFFNGDSYIPELEEKGIRAIILAGFLWKIPELLIKKFPQKIINIHPALLPKYGGKGMYGMHVHQSVVANKETETGITIHLVDAHYDNGEQLFQARCPVSDTDTPEMVAEKVHQLEYAHFPKEIVKYLLQNGRN